MAKLAAALWLCGVAVGQDFPRPAPVNEAMPPSAAKSAKAPHARRSPWHYMRRLGEMEVNLAIRFSSIGIRDAGSDDELEGRQVQEPAGVSHPGNTPAGYLAGK